MRSISGPWWASIPTLMVLARARELGVETSHEGADWLIERADNFAIIFEATTARVHQHNAPLYAAAALRAIDLTPAKQGPNVVPTVNLVEHLDAPKRQPDYVRWPGDRPDRRLRVRGG